MILVNCPKSDEVRRDECSGNVQEVQALVCDAEDVNQIDPRLVTVTFEADGVTPHGLEYDKLTAILAGAIQELNLKLEGSAFTTSPTRCSNKAA